MKQSLPELNIASGNYCAQPDDSKVGSFSFQEASQSKFRTKKSKSTAKKTTSVPRKKKEKPFESNEMKRDPKLRRRIALAESLFNVKYDLMEFNDLLDDDRFVESYN